MRILSGIVVVTLVFAVGLPRVTTSAAPAAAGAQAQARMTEADYDALMKKVGPTNGAMRMKLMGGMLKDAATDAQALAACSATSRSSGRSTTNRTP